jgi:hypothetical protein
MSNNKEKPRVIACQACQTDPILSQIAEDTGLSLDVLRAEAIQESLEEREAIMEVETEPVIARLRAQLAERFPRAVVTFPSQRA